MTRRPCERCGTLKKNGGRLCPFCEDTMSRETVLVKITVDADWHLWLDLPLHGGRRELGVMQPGVPFEVTFEPFFFVPEMAPPDQTDPVVGLDVPAVKS